MHLFKSTLVRLQSRCNRTFTVKWDCMKPFRRTAFGQNILSTIGGKFWNRLPFRNECVLHSTPSKLT